MSREVRLYVEGGGDGKETKARLRTALGEFLGEVRHRARENHARWNVVVCGSRESTFEDFQTALRKHPDAFVVLVVDAEGPYSAPGPWQHLADPANDGWTKPASVDDRHCHLIVELMEAWFLADPEMLAAYYHQMFHAASLPGNANVEQIGKANVLMALSAATRDTKKGPYHKPRHAPEILERIRPAVVRKKAAQCDRLFRVLVEAITGS